MFAVISAFLRNRFQSKLAAREDLAVIIVGDVCHVRAGIDSCSHFFISDYKLISERDSQLIFLFHKGGGTTDFFVL